MRHPAYASGQLESRASAPAYTAMPIADRHWAEPGRQRKRGQNPAIPGPFASASASAETRSVASFGNLETTVEPLVTLMREHDEIHALVTTVRETAEAAVEDPGDEELGRRSLKLFRELDAYMAESLVLHIAKEEDVLFPALRGFGAELDQVIDEMVEQHDEVRLRQSIIEKVLAALNHTHDDVDAERAALAANLKDAGDQPTPELLETLWDGVKRLDWILQGHFGDEEDDLFVPALELLDEATWARLDAASRAIDL